MAQEMEPVAADIADQWAAAIQDARLREEIRCHAVDLEARVVARTEALRVSEARFRAVFEATPIGMALVALDGRILQSNQTLQGFLGKTEAELRGTPFTDLLKAHEDRPKVARHFAQETLGQNARFESELALVRRDGRTLWARLTLARLPASAGAGDLVVAMIQDVTEARRAQVALIQAERLAITGRLGASLTHEINNPLQSIIGCLSLAEETLAEPGEAARYLTVAQEELRRVTRIVAQLRDLQGGSELEQAEPVDLNEILAQLLTLNAPRCARQGVEIAWAPAHRLPLLNVAPDRIRQVFLNIMLNALDAMPQGGNLAVRAARTRQPAGVRVTLRDTGEGMPAAVAARIFEPFYSTKKKGLGLGLFTSRSIIERHGGAIEVHSRPGRGTAFAVWLPERLEQRP